MLIFAEHSFRHTHTIVSTPALGVKGRRASKRPFRDQQKKERGIKSFCTLIFNDFSLSYESLDAPANDSLIIVGVNLPPLPHATQCSKILKWCNLEIESNIFGKI